MFPESSATLFWFHSFHLRNSNIFQTRMNQTGEPMKINFDIFQIKKWISQLELKKKIKNGVICLFSSFSSWVMVFKSPKIVHFSQICADLSKKSKSVKAIYLCPSEIPHHALSENSMFYRVWAILHKILRNEITKKCWLSRNLTKFINLKR